MNMYIEGNIHSGVNKIWRVNVSILCVTQKSSYVTTVHVNSETIRNQ